MLRLLLAGLVVLSLFGPGSPPSAQAFDDFYYDDDDGWDWDFAPGVQSGGFNWYQNGWQRPQPAYSQQPIKLSMLYGEAGPAAYVLSGGGQVYNYTMSPGMTQLFREDRPWQITFDRGNGHGQQTYALKPGHYRFRMTEQGWGLFRSESMDDLPLAKAPPAPM